MEVLTMNANPKRSTMNQRQNINNPFTPQFPTGSLFVTYPNQATRAMIYALPYGQKTMSQEFANMQNRENLRPQKNQQQFGQVITPQVMPHFPRV